MDFPTALGKTFGVDLKETSDPSCVTRYAGFQGQIFPITATNFNTQILGWLPVAGYTAECDGDVVVDFQQPWARTGVRDCMVQVYVDVRFLRNGVVVANRPNYTLLEHWFREEVGENNNVDWRNHSFSLEQSIPASADDVVTVEHRYRARKIRDTGPNTYARLLIYREAATFQFQPSPVIVRTA